MEIPQEFIKRFFIKAGQNLYWAAKSEYLNCLRFPSSKVYDLNLSSEEELVQIFPFPQNSKKGFSRCWMFTLILDPEP